MGEGDVEAVAGWLRALEGADGGAVVVVAVGPGGSVVDVRVFAEGAGAVALRGADRVLGAVEVVVKAEAAGAALPR